MANKEESPASIYAQAQREALVITGLYRGIPRALRNVHGIEFIEQRALRNSLAKSHLKEKLSPKDMENLEKAEVVKQFTHDLFE